MEIKVEKQINSHSSYSTFHSSGFLFPPVSLCPHQITVYLLHTTPQKHVAFCFVPHPRRAPLFCVLCLSSSLPQKKTVIFQMYLDFFPSHALPKKKAPLTLSCSPLQGHAFPLSSPALRGWSRVLYLACFALLLLRCGRIQGQTCHQLSLQSKGNVQ